MYGKLEVYGWQRVTPRIPAKQYDIPSKFDFRHVAAPFRSLHVWVKFMHEIRISTAYSRRCADTHARVGCHSYPKYVY